MSKISNIRKCLFVCTLLLFAIGFVSRVVTERERLMGQYKLGLGEIEAGRYERGIDILMELGDYQDSLSRIEDAKQRKWRLEFALGETMFKEGDYDTALEIFNRLKDNEDFADADDAEAYVTTIDPNKALYLTAVDRFGDGEYVEAYTLFESLGKYGRSEDYLDKCEKAIKILLDPAMMEKQSSPPPAHGRGRGVLTWRSCGYMLGIIFCEKDLHKK